MQYRSPVGLGPSGKTWPRWASQRLQRTSVRRMKRLLSSSLLTASGDIGCQKLGQTVPETNLVSEVTRGLPQRMRL